MRKVLALIGLTLAAPLHALADAQSAANTVGGTLRSASDFSVLMFDVINTFKPALAIVGVLMISIIGIRMIIAQDDEAYSKAKSVVNAVIVGLIMLYLIGPFIQAFYGTTGEVVRTSPSLGTSVFNDELNGLINWFLTILAALAMFSVIFTGLRALLTANSEEGVTNLRRAIVSAAAGILLVIFRFVLSLAFGAGDPSQGIAAGSANALILVHNFFRIVEYFLGFLGLAALAVVVYAGLQYLTSFGNEERTESARKLIFRAVIGIVIIVVSFALVRFVIGAAL